MHIAKFGVLALVSVIAAGCVQRERIDFSATAGQSKIVRDGRQAITSQKARSIVLLSPASQEFVQGQRPAFVLAANNISTHPIDLRIENISVSQRNPNGSITPLPIVTYEQLATEERRRQTIQAIAVGLSVVGNSLAASQAGYGTYTGSVYTPRGNAFYSGRYYSPTAAVIANANASAQNNAIIAGTIAEGRANLGAIEREVLKDNTIMPREWVGGRIQFEPPRSEGSEPKRYVITVTIAGESHEIDVSQVTTPTS